MTFATSDMKAYKRAHYEANKDYYKAKSRARKERLSYELLGLILDYLERHPCIDCGNADVTILEFDHRNGSRKEFNISDAMTRQTSPERLMREIRKCDVRCPNCHRKMTLKRSGRGERDRTFIAEGLLRAQGMDRPSIGMALEDTAGQTMGPRDLAAACARYGLTDLTVGYWSRTLALDKFPHVTVRGHRRVRSEDFKALMEKALADATMSNAQFEVFFGKPGNLKRLAKLDACSAASL